MPSRIRLHLDESINPVLAFGLRPHGVDVTTSQDVGLRTASDAEQLAFATTEGRVLVTHDRDFLRMTRQGVLHAGVAYCVQDKYPIGDLLRALLALWGRATPSDVVNQITFL